MLIVEMFAENYYGPSFEVAALPPERLAHLASEGFDVKEVLYHGTNQKFAEFDRSYLRTAAHFYTTPDPRTAAYYGENVYACFGKQDPQADLLGDDPESAALLREVCNEFAGEFHDSVQPAVAELKQDIAQRLHAARHGEDYTEMDAEWDAEDSAEYQAALDHEARQYVWELITSATGDLYGFNGKFQDRMVNYCLRKGYRSVRFYDHNTQGEPVSVVFGGASDIVIVGQMDGKEIKRG